MTSSDTQGINLVVDPNFKFKHKQTVENSISLQHKQKAPTLNESEDPCQSSISSQTDVNCQTKGPTSGVGKNGTEFVLLNNKQSQNSEILDSFNVNPPPLPPNSKSSQQNRRYLKIAAVMGRYPPIYVQECQNKLGEGGEGYHNQPIASSSYETNNNQRGGKNKNIIGTSDLQNTNVESSIPMKSSTQSSNKSTQEYQQWARLLRLDKLERNLGIRPNSLINTEPNVETKPSRENIISKKFGHAEKDFLTQSNSDETKPLLNKENNYWVEAAKKKADLEAPLKRAVMLHELRKRSTATTSDSQDDYQKSGNNLLNKLKMKNALRKAAIKREIKHRGSTMSNSQLAELGNQENRQVDRLRLIGSISTGKNGLKSKKGSKNQQRVSFIERLKLKNKVKKTALRREIEYKGNAMSKADQGRLDNQENSTVTRMRLLKNIEGNSFKGIHPVASTSTEKRNVTTNPTYAQKARLLNQIQGFQNILFEPSEVEKIRNKAPIQSINSHLLTQPEEITLTDNPILEESVVITDLETVKRYSQSSEDDED